jgi:signal transduction histidine kinase
MENAMRHCVEMLDTWQRLIRKNPQHQTRFLVHDFVRACAESCRLAVQAGRAQMVFEALGEEAELLGDRVQLARVLANLLQNALHALPAEGGVLRVRSVISETSVRVSVSDNGCGISEENLKKIFAPSFSTRLKLGGMGLGLFIAQKVAQAHGGSVTVESALGHGATFTLELPRTAAVTADREA